MLPIIDARLRYAQDLKRLTDFCDTNWGLWEYQTADDSILFKEENVARAWERLSKNQVPHRE